MQFACNPDALVGALFRPGPNRSRDGAHTQGEHGGNGNERDAREQAQEAKPGGLVETRQHDEWLG
jgi:hypothetical protein